jgi:hypothetical protein
MKTIFGGLFPSIILIFILQLLSCNSSNFSEIIGDRLTIGEAISTKRLEISNNGKRIIFWIKNDLTLDELNVNKLNKLITSIRIKGLETDLFIIVDSNQFKIVKEKFHNVTVFSIPENCNLFLKNNHEKDKIPSCIFAVDKNYKILNLYKMVEINENQEL